MLLVALFTVLYALLIAAAPLPANYRPATANLNSRITLCRRAPPKFEVPSRLVPEAQKQDTIDKMKEHYQTKATEAQKGAMFAVPVSRWNKHSVDREFMHFSYHAGENAGSPAIGEPVKLYRDKPLPKLRFVNVPKEHQEEMKAESAKWYKDLGHSASNHVKSMKVSSDWHLNGGIREITELTFHSTVNTYTDQIGGPMIMHRPLTLKIPDVPLSDRFTIDKSVREAHKKMAADQQHPAKTSNYGTVHSNWHDSLPDANGETHKQVVVGLEEVSKNEKKRKHLGDYAVREGTSDYELIGLNAGSPSSHTGISHAAHAGPSVLNSEIPGPSNQQKQQHININSPSTHATASNSGSSQFNSGSPSSHPGPSHAAHFELLRPVSPQQPQQLHTSSPPLHNEFYMPSPGPWQTWEHESQPSQSSHPDLYTDQLWHVDSPHPPSNNRILPHANSLSSHSGLSHSGSTQSNGAVLSSQQGPQVGLPSNPGESPHANQLDDGLSPEIWNLLHHDEVYPYPWEPRQHSS